MARSITRRGTNRLRSQVGLATVSFTAVLSLVSTAANAQPNCAVGAIVTGDDAAVVAEVTRLLQEQGVGGPDEGCPNASGEVQLTDVGLTVTVVDTFGRETRREVADAPAAAIVIASVVRDDLVDDLLPIPRTPVASKTTTGQTEIEVEAPVDDGDDRLATRWRLAALSSVGSDGSLWFGAGFGGCVMIGRTCVGGRLDGRQDSDSTGAATRLETERLDIEFLVTFELPLSWSDFTLSPGTGLGVGWMRRFPDEDLSQGRDLNIDRIGLRGDVHLLAAVDLVDLVALEIGLYVGLLPFAHNETVTTSGVDVAGEPIGFVDLRLGLRSLLQ